MNAHPRIAELAVLEIDFVLSPGDRAELEQHLDSCEPCRLLVRAYRADADELRRDAVAHAPASVRTAVLSAASRPAAARSPYSQLLVAAALIGLLLIGLVLAAGASHKDDKELAVATPSPSELPTVSASATAAIRSLTPTIAARANNDDPPGIAIALLPFAESADSRSAQIHAMEMASPCGSGTQSLWYSFTADAEMTVVADTFGSSYDTILDIWQGALTSDLQNPGFENLVPVACNDNAGDGQQSEVVFAAAPGSSYVIRVTTAANSPGGLLTFHFARG